MFGKIIPGLNLTQMVRRVNILLLICRVYFTLIKFGIAREILSNRQTDYNVRI